jgi:tRNA (cmo5U34)-methyltransferase
MNKGNSDDSKQWSEETSRLFINYGSYFVPEREHQIEIITGLLSNLKGANHVVDLCCGEGLLDEAILNSFSTFTIQGLDGSDEMLRRARERLARFGNRFISGKFELTSTNWRKTGQIVDAVISSMAIHHLTGLQKQQLFMDVSQMLTGDGIFIIADIIEHTNEMGKNQAAKALDEIVRRRSIELDGNTAAFDFFQKEGWNIFRHLDPEDIDKPSPLFDQLKWLEESGFMNIDVHWMLAGHAIFSARKPVNK